MKAFMKRNAEDEFDVLLVAEAMESCGGQVVSITVLDQQTYEGALLPHLRYAVWARVEPDTFEKIDEAITKFREEW